MIIIRFVRERRKRVGEAERERGGGSEGRRRSGHGGGAYNNGLSVVILLWEGFY